MQIKQRLISKFLYTFIVIVIATNGFYNQHVANAADSSSSECLPTTNVGGAEGGAAGGIVVKGNSSCNNKKSPLSTYKSKTVTTPLKFTTCYMIENFDEEIDRDLLGLVAQLISIPSLAEGVPVYSCVPNDACRSMKSGEGENAVIDYAMCPARPGDECITKYSLKTWEKIPPDPNNPACAPRKAQQTSYVTDYLKEMQLPVPQPTLSSEISKKKPTTKTLCGVRNALNPNMDSTVVYEEQNTPFGELRVVAKATYVVDWQDKRTGTQEFYGTDGGNWPDRSMSHYWEWKGTYDITITAKWNIEWTFGQNSGTITDMETQAVIDDFRVYEAKAIIIE